MSKREVTESDFRMPEYRDAKAEDYEFRSDGALVRKDRFMTSMRTLAYELLSGHEWECADVVAAVRALMPPDEGECDGLRAAFGVRHAKA